MATNEIVITYRIPRRFRLRMRLAVWLVRLAAWVAPVGVRVEEET